MTVAIDSPQKLVRLYEKLGYDVRVTANGHYLTKAPNGGSTTTPPNWPDFRTKQNCLADARREGLLPPKGQSFLGDVDIKQIVLDDIPKLVAKGKRPTLTYTKEPEVATPTDTVKVYITKEEYAALLEGVNSKIENFEKRISKAVGDWGAAHVGYTRALHDVEARLKLLEAEERTPSAPKRVDRLAEIREEVVELLGELKPGRKVPLSYIAANVETREGDAARALSNQLKNLVKDGRIVQYRDAKGQGGVSALYSLPSEVDES